MDDIFFHKKGKQILFALNKKSTQNITEISAGIESTYAHTFNLLREMEGLKIIKSTKEGRTKFIKLTPKGKSLARIALNFEKTLNDKVKKKKSTGTKPPHENFVDKFMLEKYKDALESLSGDLKSKKIKKKDTKKYEVILKRYKSIVSRLKPKDKAGKKLKSDVLSLIKKIELVLK